MIYNVSLCFIMSPFPGMKRFLHPLLCIAQTKLCFVVYVVAKIVIFGCFKSFFYSM